MCAAEGVLMNHVFYKLANDAWVDVPEGQGYAGKVFDKEKFAESIIRECVDICYNTTGNSYLNGVAAGNKIMLHFGLKNERTN
jgi:hypothetical protein